MTEKKARRKETQNIGEKKVKFSRRKIISWVKGGN